VLEQTVGEGRRMLHHKLADAERERSQLGEQNARLRAECEKVLVPSSVCLRLYVSVAAAVSWAVARGAEARGWCCSVALRREAGVARSL
jgi:hypothetical protein